MKQIIMLAISLLVALNLYSQTTSTQRVKTIINGKDTLIEFSLSDAKTILEGVLNTQNCDSVVGVYIERDSLQNNRIILQNNEIKDLNLKINNETLITSNLSSEVSNKDKQIGDINDIIKQQKKEIRRQKFYKIIGFAAAIIIPITILTLK